MRTEDMAMCSCNAMTARERKHVHVLRRRFCRPGEEAGGYRHKYQEVAYEEAL